MKKHLSVILALIYVSALLLSIVITVKSGAAIFYIKTPLEAQNFVKDSGYTHRYKVNLPPALFPADDVLVYEAGQQLRRALSREVIQTGDGTFVTEESADGGFNVFIAPTGNSNPNTNGKTYWLYSRGIFFSQTLGILYLGFLLFGFLKFAVFTFRIQNRGGLFRLNGILQAWERFLTQLATTSAHIYKQTQAPWRFRVPAWGKLLVITVGAAYGLVFWEWLFQATKVSFMDSLDFLPKVEIFLLTGLTLAAAAVAVTAVLLLFEVFLHPLRISWLGACTAAAVPAVLITFLLILGLDNFTYTLFRFGILTSSGLLRSVYGVAILLIYCGVYLWVLRLWGLVGPARMETVVFKWIRVSLQCLVLISLALAVIRFDRDRFGIKQDQDSILNLTELPNIILIGSDGVSAHNMSLYGYQRDTTPQISQLAEVSLVAENAFTNSGNTYGSVISMLNSKMPTRTRVVYHPDILKGVDTHQHLPGILKELGYTNIQMGVPQFVDANSANLQDGFDLVNQRSIKMDFVKSLRKLGYDLPAFFILEVGERLVNRLFQAFYITTIENPFSVVTKPISWENDNARLQELLEILDNRPDNPVFAHVHLLVTHGRKFEPARRVYSIGQEQDLNWMTDFYDDAVLTFDRTIGTLVNSLKTNGQYDRTIIIVYSDHAMQWESNERIPLLIHFPGDQYTGSVQSNVQNLDIAPTILDYLGIPIPDWMEGQSILQLNSQKRQPIFAASTDSSKIESFDSQSGLQGINRLETTNYLFSSIQIIDCQFWYSLDVMTNQWDSGEVAGHTAPCAAEDLLGMDQIKQEMDNFLSAQGYEFSIIP